MPVNPYAVLLALSEDERRQLTLLTEDDDLFDSAICGSMHYWRDHLLPRYGDPVLCRQVFLLHAKLKLLRGIAHPGFDTKVMAALLLTLADRVEARVSDETEGFDCG
jgi:hypothetical protein